MAIYLPSLGLLVLCTMLLCAPSCAEIQVPEIVINEIGIQEGRPFIELKAAPLLKLSALSIVLYDGVSAAALTSLTGYRIGDTGFFTIGTPGEPAPDATMPNLNLFGGLRAVALYYGIPMDFQQGSVVTAEGLVDAIVYASEEPDTLTIGSDLTLALSPGQYPVRMDQYQDGGPSLSRCRGWSRNMPQSFRNVLPSHGADNVCSLPEFVINEFEINDRPEFIEEFIEISDGGIGFQSLDGVMLVMYNGNIDEASVSDAFDLSGYSTNANGLAVVGSANQSYTDIPVEFSVQFGLLRAGTAGVALHLGGPASKFLLQTSVNNYNLIDAIVYWNINVTSDPNVRLLHALLPFQSFIDEPDWSDGDEHSISRCVCCQALNSSVFGASTPTPGALNENCDYNSLIVSESNPHYLNQLVINEVHIGSLVDQDGDFIEIFSGDLKNRTLDGTEVLLFGNDDVNSAYKTFDLSGMQTDADGFFVISSFRDAIDSLPSHLILQDQEFLHKTAGGIIIRQKCFRPSSIPLSQQSDCYETIDAIVYGSPAEYSDDLLEKLAPGQPMMPFQSFTGGNSILRCYSMVNPDVLAFDVGTPSLGNVNVCPDPEVTINEMNIDSDATDSRFIELKSHRPLFPINKLILAFWKSKKVGGHRLKNSIRLNNLRTDINGFLLIAVSSHFFPHPDAVIQFEAFNRMRALSLHKREDNEDVSEDNPAGLLDAVVFRSEFTASIEFVGDLLALLTPGDQEVYENAAFSDRDEGISRCLVDDRREWIVAHLSPKARNHCPNRQDVFISINEINLNPSEQFIELWDHGEGFTSLDNFLVVLFGEDGLSKRVISLGEFASDFRGYFVIGTAAGGGQPHLVMEQGSIATRSGAVAVYRTQDGSFPLNWSPTSADGLIDVLMWGDKVTHLSAVLGDHSQPLNSEVLPGQSFSRCFLAACCRSDSFAARPQTPGSLNDCPTLPRDVVINEIHLNYLDADYPEQFIELFDGGRGNTPLQYLTLVFYNGQERDLAYYAVDLNGYRTNSAGYFMIGTGQTQDANTIAVPVTSYTRGELLPTGSHAIALHRAPVGAFPRLGAEATPVSLIDVLVYTTMQEDEVPSSLTEKLLPGSSPLYVQEATVGVTGGTSRCLGTHPLDPLLFVDAPSTLGQENSCPNNRHDTVTTSVILNEVNLNTQFRDTGVFIELYDGGFGNTALDGLIVVFYNGDHLGRSHFQLDLSSKRTNQGGYFVIGSRHVLPDLIVNPSDIVRDGLSSVALHQADIEYFPLGRVATQDNIVDVVIFNQNNGEYSTDQSAISDLAPGQPVLQEIMASQERDQSLSRCLSNRQVSMFSFINAEPTPGVHNGCSRLPVVINEISVLRQPYQGEMFVELFHAAGFTPLDGYFLVILEERSIVQVISLQNRYTNGEGYLAITQQDGVTIPTGGTGAIVLYQRDAQDPQKVYTLTDYGAVNILDALVYTNVSDASILGRILNTPAVLIQNLSGRENSLSRCTCCMQGVNSPFILTRKSPGHPNICPTEQFKQTIRMRLIDADYKEWKGNARLVQELRRQIVNGITQRCRCSFQESFITGETLIEGSVIYKADMLSVDATQQQVLKDSYQDFLKNSNKIVIFGQAYKVDAQCVFEECKGGAPVGVIVVVSVVVLAIVIVLSAVAFVYYRKGKLRKSSADRSMDPGEFKVTKECKLNELDELGETQHDAQKNDLK